VAGDFTDAVDFGGGALTNAGGLDVFAASFDGDGAHRWSVAFGGPGEERGWAIALGATRAQVAGQFEQTVDFGDGPRVGAGIIDGFAVALETSSGTHAGTTTFGSAETDIAYDVHVDDADNVWLTGCFGMTVSIAGEDLVSNGNGDVLVVRTGPSGTFATSFGASGSFDCGNGVHTDSAANAAVVGSFEGTMDVDGTELTSLGGVDGFVTKIVPR
jgi:hypothetical protein